MASSPPPRRAPPPAPAERPPPSVPPPRAAPPLGQPHSARAEEGGGGSARPASVVLVERPPWQDHDAGGGQQGAAGIPPTVMAVEAPVEEASRPAGAGSSAAAPAGAGAGAGAEEGESLSQVLPGNGGLCGLKNLGNTCFLNSVVQCIAHIRPLASGVIFSLEVDKPPEVDKQPAAAKPPDPSQVINVETLESFKEGEQVGHGPGGLQPGGVVFALRALLGHIWSGQHGSGPLEPLTLLAALKKDKRCGSIFTHKQEDAHECLCLLFHIIHQDTNGMLPTNHIPSPPFPTPRRSIDTPPPLPLGSAAHEKGGSAYGKKTGPTTTAANKRDASNKRDSANKMEAANKKDSANEKDAANKRESGARTAHEEGGPNRDSGGEWDLVSDEVDAVVIDSEDSSVEMPPRAGSAGVPGGGSDAGEGEGEFESDVEAEGEFEGLDSVVSKFLGGTTCSQVTCKACGYFTQNLEGFNTLSLPLPPRRYSDGPGGSVTAPTHLDECFQLLEDEDPSVSWVCDRCGVRDASKRMWVVSHPRVLVVHLERFGYIRGRRFKRDDAVRVPVVGMVRTNRARDPSAKPSPSDVHQVYDLISWTDHLGATDTSGHYTAVAQGADGAFRRFDDHRVARLLPHPGPTLSSSSAYLLFYLRRDA